MTRPCLIGLDWGTSSLRAMLIDGAGCVIEENARPWGITHLPPGGFRAAYDAMTAAWRAAWPGLPCLAAGMVGSRQGWVEAPYCDAPAGAEALASRLATVAEAGLFIIPGIVLSSPRPDVMRGEETQVIGALDDAGNRCMVLPGSHSKWVDIEAGRITGFRTFMTGEVFAALRDHTILGAFPAPETPDQDSFDRGVHAAHDTAEGVASLLFSARALVLTGRLPASGALDYLSGLLIGDELRSAPKGVQLLLVGEASLCRRYRRAMRLCGIHVTLADPGVTARGLWRIACCAGLVATDGKTFDVP
ncbi:MAG TPA: 2-dehydro-3-deoxygalactonokinase [Acetobacteraceae bacterium]|nr:2-dehydro-3-deoxygalactonokinase [Acetobacteraceae bacterium]